MLVPGVLSDTYSYGLKAQPGGCVGRAVTTPGSWPISVPARPLSEDQRANPGSGRRILTHPRSHSYHASYDNAGRQRGMRHSRNGTGRGRTAIRPYSWTTGVVEGNVPRYAPCATRDERTWQREDRWGWPALTPALSRGERGKDSPPRERRGGTTSPATGSAGPGQRTLHSAPRRPRMGRHGLPRPGPCPTT